MNSKKAITLLLIATMVMGLIPLVPVSAALAPQVRDAADGAVLVPAEIMYDYTISVYTNVIGEVPSGETVELYWDDSTITTWNGEAGFLNSSKAKSNGKYDIWFTIPEAEVGDHYVWVKTDSAAPKSVVITVVPSTDLSASSGRPSDKIDVMSYGLNTEKDAMLVMVDTVTAGAGATAPENWVIPAANDIAAENIGTGDGIEKDFDGTLDTAPIQPGSFVPAGTTVWTDDGVGGLTSVGGGTGSINYVTGEYDLTFNTAPAAAVTAAYTNLNDVADTLYVLTSSGDTDSVGSYSKEKATIPAGVADKDYYIYTIDAKNVDVNAKFVVGAVITLTPDSGPVGSVVRVEGRGFTVANSPIVYGVADNTGTMGVSLRRGAAGATWGCLVEEYVPATGIVIEADKSISFNVIIPDTDDPDDDYILEVADGTAYANADFEVTEEPEITVTPDYGAQGSTITIEGMYFTAIKDTTVTVELWDEGLTAKQDDIDTFDVDSDGSFSGTARVPTQVDATYKVVAYIANVAPHLAGDAWNQDATSTFRVGTILVLLSDNEGVAGEKIVLTGNGFSLNKKWNATFGGDDLFTDKDVTGTGLLGANNWYVPQVAPGDYDIVVTDEETDITVTVPFTVTAATAAEVDPGTAPSGYNVTLSGTNWSEEVKVFEFMLFNATDEWDISADVKTGAGAGVAVLGATGLPDGDHPGDWDAWWVVADDNNDDIDKGSYTLNVTYGDWFMQLPVIVGDDHSFIGPRKAVFKIGDTVSFNIEHSFGNVAEAAGGEINNGHIEIYDPSGNKYWETDLLPDWTKSGMYYYVPAADQLENKNPMVLLDDAPLGEWTYKWYENDQVAAAGGDGSLIEEGTFSVEAAAADVISGQVEDLANALDDLSTDLSGVTAEFDDVKSDIAGVESAVADAISAAEAAAEAVTAVAATANTASEAAADAAEAANAARDAASGLTTLVYGAIGAALVAALAAIVSLMQISRRIAG